MEHFLSYIPFKEQHYKIIEYVNGYRSSLNTPFPNESEIEQYTLHENYKCNLISLGLIGYRKHNSNFSITKLGDMLLKLIGFENEFERDFGHTVNPFEISQQENKKFFEDLTQSIKNINIM